MSDRSKQISLTPTLENIALRSGVSIATVSRVINSSGPVSKDVEKRVRQAIDELGFTHTRKKSKMRIKPKNIALIVPEFLNPANSTIMTGAYEEAVRVGARLFVLPVPDKQEYHSVNLDLLKEIHCDGIILLHNYLEAEMIQEMYYKHPIPIILLNKNLDQTKFHCIDTDREIAMYQVIRYLVSLNHRRIVYVAYDMHYSVCQSRLRGVMRAFRESGMVFNEETSYNCFPTIEDGFKACNNLLLLPEDRRPTAIVAFNDLIAIGALHAIRAKGLQVPGDISVIGFDDIYMAAHTNPPLSTVAQPKRRMGQIGVRTIINILNGQNTSPGGLTLLECPLIIRESTSLCTK
jgi:DNA-binding LacI/PurR family transcriptional regulator